MNNRRTSHSVDFSGGRFKSKSALSVRTVDYCLSLPQTHANRAPSAVTLATSTPGRRMIGRSMRDLEQDMAALRASRQDNPYLQAVTAAHMASRESLDDCLDDSGLLEDADDARLVAREWTTSSTTTGGTPQHLNLDPDYSEPLAIAELHEHLIRSPPPVPWPPHSPAHQHFQFPGPASPTPSHQYGVHHQHHWSGESESEDNGNNAGGWGERRDGGRYSTQQSPYGNNSLQQYYGGNSAGTSSSSPSQMQAALRSPRPFGILRVGVGASDSGAEDAVHLMADSKRYPDDPSDDEDFENLLWAKYASEQEEREIQVDTFSDSETNDTPGLSERTKLY